jgi:integrase
MKMSRNPKAPIQRILDMQHPIEAVFLLLDRLEQAAKTVFGGSKGRAALRRDMALIAILASNPLRGSHFSRMTYNPADDSSNLYRRDGRLHIRFERESFKNFRGSACRDYDYDYPVSEFAVPYVETYLNEYRNQFTWEDNLDLVFLNHMKAKGPQCGVDTLSTRLRDLTFLYIPELAPYGFGIHAFRHIVATEFIKNQLDGFEVAARVLHDTVQAVRDAYSELKGIDHAKIYTAYSDVVHNAYQGRKKAA